MNCELIKNKIINKEIFRLDFILSDSLEYSDMPKAGNFFMVKPKRTSVFLGRPISVALWEPALNEPYLKKPNTVRFLIARRGRGTQELADMRIGEEAELIGPLGNAWADFLPSDSTKPVALVSGGIGIAPLIALLGEFYKQDKTSSPAFDFYAGFKKSFESFEEEISLLGTVLLAAQKKTAATEDGKTGNKGLITDFLDPEKYATVFACGPQPMLKTVAEKCKAANVPCFVSLERQMACGLGACLGCTIKTVNGNRRCCADGPIFNAEEVVFDD